MSERTLLILLELNLALAFLVSFQLTMYLQKRFAASKVQIFLFFLLFLFSVPVIGYIFAFWIAYYLNNVRYKKTLKHINIIDLEEFERSFVEIKRIFGEGSMIELMQNDYAPSSLKIKALVVMADNITKNNINIIRQGLASGEDEVRLYSFAILNRLEQSLNQKINAKLSIFHKSPRNSKEKADAAVALANLYWDMIYYELSEENTLRDYILLTVSDYIRIACQTYNYDIKLHVLLGRIHLFRHEYDRAATEFAFAYHMIPEENAYNMPYLAEIGFNLGFYKLTKGIMTHITGLNYNSTLYPLVEQWKGTGNG
jgi:polysaccharide biosynthesis protein PelE